MLDEFSKERFARVAARQSGRISHRQLLELGFTSFAIHHWVQQGHLTKVHPRVYAVGHTAQDRRADPRSAVLYAGPGAALSHATAAFHRGLIDYTPAAIEVTTSHRVQSIPGNVLVFAETKRERELIDGIPTCLIPDVIVDMAATGTPRMVKRALAQLDYRRALTPSMIAAIEACCGRGRAGSVTTRKALRHHKPQYAFTKSDIEDLFIDLCAKWRTPLPLCNIKLHGITVDAYWPQFSLVVEVDGGGNHDTEGQVDRDRTNDLALRAHGLTVVRYSKRQLKEDHGPVREDLIRHMQPAASSAASTRLLRAA